MIDKEQVLARATGQSVAALMLIARRGSELSRERRAPCSIVVCSWALPWSLNEHISGRRRVPQGTGIVRIAISFEPMLSEFGRSATHPTLIASTLRLVDAVKVDYLLRDLNRDIWLHVCVEESVVLLPRLPHLGNDETVGIFIRDVEKKAWLLF